LLNKEEIKQKSEQIRQALSAFKKALEDGTISDIRIVRDKRLAICRGGCPHYKPGHSCLKDENTFIDEMASVRIYECPDNRWGPNEFEKTFKKNYIVPIDSVESMIGCLENRE